EEVRGRDDGLLVVQPIHRGVVAGLDADEQLPRQPANRRLRQDLGEDSRGDLAAAAAAVRELRETNEIGRSVHGIECRMDVKGASTVTVAQLDAFDEVIDVRSPTEFSLDHVPGALNCPVLDDEERARVGTTYKQISAFDAKREGAALVSRNI